MYNTNDIKEQMDLEKEKTTFTGTFKKVFVVYDTDGDRWVSNEPNGVFLTRDIVDQERKKNAYLHIREEWALVSSAGVCLLLKGNAQYNINKNIKETENKILKEITNGLTDYQLDLLKRRGLKI